jgi:hypothetical protein
MAAPTVEPTREIADPTRVRAATWAQTTTVTPKTPPTLHETLGTAIAVLLRERGFPNRRRKVRSMNLAETAAGVQIRQPRNPILLGTVAVERFPSIGVIKLTVELKFHPRMMVDLKLEHTTT